MICPTCQKTLIVVERNGIELDYCPACEGFWFDADEWYLLKDVLGIQAEISDPFALEPVRTNEKARKCPQCSKYMEKVDIGGIILDRCPSLHGVWFDKGEVSSFFNLAQTGEKETNKAVNFLGEIFYKS